MNFARCWLLNDWFNSKKYEGYIALCIVSDSSSVRCDFLFGRPGQAMSRLAMKVGFFDGHICPIARQRPLSVNNNGLVLRVQRVFISL